MTDSTPLLVFICVPDIATGEVIANALVAERLAACVNILPGVSSVFWWEGKIQHETELLLMAKTLRSQFVLLSDWVLQLHPYAVPEIISVDIREVHEPYLAWMKQEISPLHNKIQN